ncbi:MAG: hypothetical protein Q4A74_06415 [Cardiobacteriaceae bacterium]|nr:hypothetical protein [Cardiobacteriaceae bacterium]
MTEKEKIISRVVNATRRSNVIQIRINDEDMETIQVICKELNLKASSLAYEFFQYALDAYLQEKSEASVHDDQLKLFE